MKSVLAATFFWLASYANPIDPTVTVTNLPACNAAMTGVCEGYAKTALKRLTAKP